MDSENCKAKIIKETTKVFSEMKESFSKWKSKFKRKKSESEENGLSCQVDEYTANEEIEGFIVIEKKSQSTYEVPPPYENIFREEPTTSARCLQISSTPSNHENTFQSSVNLSPKTPDVRDSSLSSDKSIS